MARNSIHMVSPWCNLPYYSLISRNEFLDVVPSGDFFSNFEDKLFDPNRITLSSNDDYDFDHEADNLIKQCNYKTLRQINENTNANKKLDFSTMHLNIRSLKSNQSKLINTISSFSKPFSIIGLSETWLYKDQESNFKNCMNYKGFFKSRTTRGGGVGIYVDKSFKVKERTDLKFNNDNSDCLTVEIILENKSNILITVLYKPPNENLQDFNHDLELYLSLLTKEKKKSYLLGDYNIDLLKLDHHQLTSNFYNILKSYNHIPLIYKPTRITHTSASLIDNIFTNDNSATLSGILLCDISDHLPVYSFSTDKVITHKTIIINYRKMNRHSIENFNNLLANETWDDVLLGGDTNNSYNHFESKLSSIFNKSFPQVSKKVKLFNNTSKPWLTTGIIISIQHKSKLYKKYLKSPTPIHRDNYKKFNNLLKRIIRLAERNYYHNKFNQALGNIKESWNIINEILNRSKI